MKYLATDFLDSLANYCDNLVRSENIDPSDVLLVEESSLPLLVNIKTPLDLIILVEEIGKLPNAGIHNVVRSVYKYNKIAHLLCEIFDIRHPIRLFLSTSSELHINETAISEIADSPFIDVISQYNYSPSLLNTEWFLENGTYFMYSSPVDVLDPPTGSIINIILEQSKKDCVDIVSYGLKGALDHRLIQLADTVLLFCDNAELELVEQFAMRYPHIIPVLNQRDKKHFSMDDLPALSEYLSDIKYNRKYFSESISESIYEQRGRL